MYRLDEKTIRSTSVFGWMLGSWLIERNIPGHASARGHAEVTLVNRDEALYSEKVHLRLETGNTLLGKRSYIFRRTEWGFDVMFDDSRLLFQSLRFLRQENSLIAEAIHDCGADRYASNYYLGEDNSYVVRHAVEGPRKSYVSTTKFLRVISPNLCARTWS